MPLYARQSNGFSYRSNGDMDIMKVNKGALTMTRARRTASNIYKLLGSTVAGDIVSTESNNDAAMCLDHLNEFGMMELHKRNLLMGVPSCKMDLCKYCVLGKQCCVRLNAMKHQTEGILAYVHYDVWWPTKEVSMGGYRHIFTFIDDFSCKFRCMSLSISLKSLSSLSCGKER